MTNEKALYKPRAQYLNDLSMVGKNTVMRTFEWNFWNETAYADAPEEITDSFLTTFTRWRLSRQTVFTVLYCIYSMPTFDHREPMRLPPDRFFFQHFPLLVLFTKVKQS